MKRKFAVLAGLIIACLCLSHVIVAQEKVESGEIKVSITKNVEGKSRSFKKTYKSVDEMKNDEDLRDFYGEDVMEWVGVDEDGKNKIAITIDSNDNNQILEFDGDTDANIKVITLDDTDDSKDLDLQIKKMVNGNDIQMIVEALTDDDDVVVIKNSPGLEISNVEKGDFGKKSLVSENESLDENKLSIRADSDIIRIKYPLEKTERVKVSAFDDKDDLIYTSIDKNASDKISHLIDISHWDHGDYWIELTIGKRRLTKKVKIKD